ncbi:hypothetical protein N7509_008767 [Penicillium cosmopolitanum]|uniref:Uncharacterized protein n=1 Tax=Penicillium cosmopolitanum TaxID=1131564 RepID=A0A9X0B313_9EURO|nr:uncharacterized protein N7509_008767 [Penicillium cosmopolitanum]KAJ5386226.1 hypothetical protein N7509_008767 [Penicillium cosmopolitanum]
MPRRGSGRERIWQSPNAPESSQSFERELFISAEEGEGPLEEVQGKEGTERRRKASWTEL